MDLWKKLKGELIDIIEWLDTSSDIMVYRFERYGNEIKYGAQLVVRESQNCVFINEGQLADVFGPGTYTLETKNMPILTTLKGWKYGFASPFKAEVYFVNMKNFTNQKWGTMNPVMMRDPEFGPIRIRAFGTYTMRVKDPGLFLKEIVGTDKDFTTEEISTQLRNLIVSRFSDVIGESKIPILDLAANYDEMGGYVTQRIQQDFLSYGLDVNKLLVENISLPPAVEEALDKRSSMGIVGNLQNYMQFQAANAMQDAAANPGGVAAGGIGMGMGFAMANQMAQSMAGQMPQAPGSSPSGPPPLPNATVMFYVAVNNQQSGPFDLNAIRQMIGQGSIQRTHLVWRAGMSQWIPADQAPELTSFFGSIPPPLPPTP
ncbi:MAG: SPFH domain-containing protein [Candidatus Delongbacteria bacterium]|nr:SPFH domain-containing protein [Candidatus Delongbacteria bacterium]